MALDLQLGQLCGKGLFLTGLSLQHTFLTCKLNKHFSHLIVTSPQPPSLTPPLRTDLGLIFFFFFFFLSLVSLAKCLASAGTNGALHPREFHRSLASAGTSPEPSTPGSSTETQS